MSYHMASIENAKTLSFQELKKYDERYLQTPVDGADLKVGDYVSVFTNKGSKWLGHHPVVGMVSRRTDKTIFIRETTRNPNNVVSIDEHYWTCPRTGNNHLDRVYKTYYYNISECINLEEKEAKVLVRGNKFNKLTANFTRTSEMDWSR